MPWVPIICKIVVIAYHHSNKQLTHDILELFLLKKLKQRFDKKSQYVMSFGCHRKPFKHFLINIPLILISKWKFLFMIIIEADKLSEKTFN